MAHIAARTKTDFTFNEWLEGLAEVSTRLCPEWDEDLRRDFYEAAPAAWRNYYDTGCTPEYAVRADMATWSSDK